MKRERNHLAINGNKKKICLQPQKRIEFWNPNHWANEADTLVFKIDKSNKQRSKEKKKNSERIQPD